MTPSGPGSTCYVAPRRVHRSHEDCLGSVTLSSRCPLHLFPGPLRAKRWAEPGPHGPERNWSSGLFACLWGHGHMAWAPSVATGLPTPQMPLGCPWAGGSREHRVLFPAGRALS